MTIWQALKAMKKKNSKVPGELPASLRAEFLPWLTEPASDTLNSIIITQSWPEQWKIEFGSPVQKKHPAPSK